MHEPAEPPSAGGEASPEGSLPSPDGGSSLAGIDGPPPQPPPPLSPNSSSRLRVLAAMTGVSAARPRAG